MLKRILVLIILLVETFYGFAQSNQNLDLLSNFAYPVSRGRLSDVWGYSNGTQEYALVGMFDGVSIVDVTDPVNPNEVFYISDAGSVWKDLKVWNNHVYITNETSGGLMIIDMSNLPGIIDSLDVYFYNGTTYPFTTAHNIYIDENGIAYILGSNNGVGGAILLDLNVDPKNPLELGRYDEFYLHDAMVKNNILWGSAILNGFFTIVDVNDKANPVTLASHATPNAFTHNSWISDDENTLFTTDEVSNAFIGAYDVSDLANIAELDRVQSSPGNNVIPHNTHFINDYLVTSYYNDGVVIHDVSNPENMIEVGHYDTSPLLSGGTSDGCWGAYPYLPSGNILGTDRDNGLFVLGPNYVRGAGLEGTVTNSLTLVSLDDVTIEIVASTVSAKTNLVGNYSTGLADAGSYDIIYSKPWFIPDTIFNVTLSNGVTVVQDVQLTPILVITSLSDLNNDDQLSVYPNPFKSEINIFIKDKNIKNITVEVADITGKIIDKREFEGSESIRYFNEYVSGVYFISIYSDGKLINIQKLVKH